MILADTCRKVKRNSRYRLTKVQERKVLRLYMKEVMNAVLGGQKFDFPNKFGTVAVTQKEKSVMGKSASRNIAPAKMFDDVKQLSYKGVITDGGAIKFIPSQEVTAMIRKSKINYRFEILTQ